jgi:hypothetical protein
MPLSQLALNNIVWTLSLILQVSLVAAVFARKIPRSFPAFAALIIFYPVRAVLLYGLYGHLATGTYESTYGALATLDLLLQATVMGEITLHVVRELGGWTIKRVGFIVLLLIVTAGCTTAIVTSLPQHAAQPVDRGQIFASVLMLTVSIWALIAARASLLRSIVLGLALYSSTGLAAQVARNVAVARRDRIAFERWSYVSAAAYLIVVVLWLLTLKLQVVPEPEASA